MATTIYYNTALTLAVGQTDVFTDLEFDIVDGSVYRLVEADLLFNGVLDSANGWHCGWMSVLKDGRATYNPFNDNFPGDIIGNIINIQATRPFGGFPFESPSQGYIADDPYFEYRLRLGLSTAVAVAGGAVTIGARVVAERVTATATIRQLMYNRSYT